MKKASQDPRRLRSPAAVTLTWRWGTKATPALIILGIGLALTLVAFALVRTRDWKRNEVEFKRDSAELGAHVRQSFQLPLEVLHSLPSFFEASDRVTRSEFKKFTVHALERHPAIAAIEWIPLVTAAQRPAMESEARRDGLTEFEFRDQAADGQLVAAGQRSEYLPIFYQEPPRPVIGLDLAHARSAPALLEARDRGVPVATDRLPSPPPAEGAAELAAVAVYHPVSRQPPEVDSDPVFIGCVAVVFRVDKIMADALAGSELEGQEVALVDGAASQELGLLFAAGVESVAEIDASELRWSLGIPIADREWTLTTAPTPDWMASSAAWVVLGAGAGASVFLAVGSLALATIFGLRKQVDAAMQLGQYRLETKIGQGGMGEVWRASHSMLRRPTAVKLIRPDSVEKRTLIRFDREAQAMSSLTHPNTVSVFDYGHTKDGVCYYAMEYLPGINFAELVRQWGPQPPSRVIHLLHQVCGSLYEAHSMGIVHRDIKPENLIICERGKLYDVVKVLDFGIAKLLEKTPGDVSLTAANVVIGTPLYLPPEALTLSVEIEPRSDLFSVGATAYFLLTGAVPFPGSNVVEVSINQLNKELTPPSEKLGAELPRDLEEIVLGCLEKDIERRPSSALELAEKLETCRDWGRWTAKDARAWWRENRPGR